MTVLPRGVSIYARAQTILRKLYPRFAIIHITKQIQVMKKFILSLLAILMMSAASGLSAQGVFAKGTKVVSLGVGLGHYSGLSLPPLSVTYDQSIKDDLFDGKGAIGLGAEIEYANAGTLLGNYSLYFAAARGTLHYQFVNKLDTYAGLKLGFLQVSALGGVFGWTSVLGARYELSERFGLFAEFNHGGLSSLKAGVSFKL